MHNNQPRPTRQRRLQFGNDELWTMLPEPVRERCRTLMEELLASVVNKDEGRPNERKD